jgi:hypothetical protein
LRLTVVEYAKRRRALGLPGGCPAAVYKAIKTGRIPGVGADKRLDVEDSDLQWLRNTRGIDGARAARRELRAEGVGRAPPRSPARPAGPATTPSAAEPRPDGFPADIGEARLRREHYAAELARCKLDRELGLVVPWDTAERELLRLGRLLRERLGHLGSAVAGRVVGLTSVAEVAAAVDLEVEAALRETADALLDEVRGAASQGAGRPTEDRDAVGAPAVSDAA